MKYKNHYDRIEAAKNIIVKMMAKGYKEEEIVKAVFIETSLGKQWTKKTLEVLK